MPNKEEKAIAEATAKIEKKAGRFERAVEKYMGLHKEANQKLDTTAKVAPFTPIAGMTATYVTGRIDAMVGTPDVKNPATIAGGVLSWVGSAVSAWQGWSIPAVTFGAIATAELGALTHDVGYDAGIKSKAQG